MTSILARSRTAGLARAWYLVAGAVLAVAIVVLAAWVLWPPSRHPVPLQLIETAQIPGYKWIRFWGDENTTSFDAAMTKQYRDVREAADGGRASKAGLTEATFLSISGGGDKGAFTAGLLKGWTDSGNRPNFESVTGVSTGALAAPFVFLGPKYDDVLKKIYTDTDANQLYDNRWVFGLFMDALKGTGPLKSLIEEHTTEAFLDEIAAEYRKGRRLLVSTTNLDAQRPVIWDLSAIAASGQPDRRRLFVNVLLASSAIPGVFPPARLSVVADDGKTYDELHVDGGATAQMIFMPPEVKMSKLEDKVFDTLRQRKLYVIRNGKLAPEYEPAQENSLKLAQRGVATLVKYQVLANLRLLKDQAKAGRTLFLYDAIPAAFEGDPPEKFDPVYERKLFDVGRDVGFRQDWSMDVPETPELAR